MDSLRSINITRVDYFFNRALQILDHYWSVKMGHCSCHNCDRLQTWSQNELNILYVLHKEYLESKREYGNGNQLNDEFFAKAFYRNYLREWWKKNASNLNVYGEEIFERHVDFEFDNQLSN